MKDWNQLALEHKALVKEKSQEFYDLVSDNADIFKLLWQYGDGDGGHVLGTIREAVTGEFFKTYAPNPNKKKKISNKLRKQVFERDKYRCKHCETHLDLSCDHIHPESKGGETTLENLQTLCRSCNSKKGVNT